MIKGMNSPYVKISELLLEYQRIHPVSDGTFLYFLKQLALNPKNFSVDSERILALFEAGYIKKIDGKYFLNPTLVRDKKHERIPFPSQLIEGVVK